MKEDDARNRLYLDSGQSVHNFRSYGSLKSGWFGGAKTHVLIYIQNQCINIYTVKTQTYTHKYTHIHIHYFFIFFFLYKFLFIYICDYNIYMKTYLASRTYLYDKKFEKIFLKFKYMSIWSRSVLNIPLFKKKKKKKKKFFFFFS